MSRLMPLIDRYLLREGLQPSPWHDDKSAATHVINGQASMANHRSNVESMRYIIWDGGTLDAVMSAPSREKRRNRIKRPGAAETLVI